MFIQIAYYAAESGKYCGVPPNVLDIHIIKNAIQFAISPCAEMRCSLKSPLEKPQHEEHFIESLMQLLAVGCDMSAHGNCSSRVIA